MSKDGMSRDGRRMSPMHVTLKAGQCLICLLGTSYVWDSPPIRESYMSSKCFVILDKGKPAGNSRDYSQSLLWGAIADVGLIWVLGTESR